MELDIVYFVIVPVVLFFLKDLYLKNWNDNKEKRERRKLWIATLRTNDEIRKCLDRFDDLQKIPVERSKYYLIPSFVFGALIFLISVFSEGELNIALLKTAGCFNVLLLFPVFLFAYYTNKLENKKEYTEKEAENVALAYRTIYWFSYGYNVMVVSLVLLLVVAIGSTEITDYIGIISNYLFIFMFFALTYVLAKSSKKMYEKHLMYALNCECKDKYPFVHVHTKDCELGGYIQDIFDEKLITLTLGEQVTVFEWDNLIILILGSLRQIKFMK